MRVYRSRPSSSISMAGLVKWGIKLGAVGGAVYLAASERFFGSTKETADAYGRLKGWGGGSGWMLLNLF